MTNIEIYGAVMKEIKLRKEVIDLFLSGRLEARFVPTTIETIGLQFRKVFELIVFASLAANQYEYSRVYADFAKHWEAGRLLKNLRKINPRFYPKPIVEVRHDRPEVVDEHKDRDQDYLTESELAAAHGKCGSLMHAANPFTKPIDYEAYKRDFHSWMTKIVNLLSSHQIHLLGDTGFWLVHMHEEGKGNEVSWYRFERGSAIGSETLNPRSSQ
jgi:hypothetical protein